ncbi:MAG: cation diffusion facilitator family transporter [Cyanobacteria bacterium P01_G01_bin.38]
MAHSHHGHHKHPGHHERPGHAHTPSHYDRAFMIGTALNIGFVIVEAGFGVITQSLALLADAGHNLSDVLGLLLAWGGSYLAQRPPTQRYTYGLRRSSILAALLNSLILLVAMGGIAWEALRRFNQASPPSGITIMVVAGIGVAINTATALLFMSGRQRDLNIKGAFLHMAADALVSLGVVIAGLGILLTGWQGFDPVVSLLIVAVVVWGTWQLLQDALNLSLDAVPNHIEPVAVRTWLAEFPGVAEVHDLHIWAMSTTEVALTTHLIMPAGHPGDEALIHITQQLKQKFRIDHTTIQIEIDDAEQPCVLAPEEAV